MSTQRTHPLTVKINRALFEQVRDMLIATDAGKHQRRCGHEVPWGAWSDLLETILRQWLAEQQQQQRNAEVKKPLKKGMYRWRP